MTLVNFWLGACMDIIIVIIFGTSYKSYDRYKCTAESQHAVRNQNIGLKINVINIPIVSLHHNLSLALRIIRYYLSFLSVVIHFDGELNDKTINIYTRMSIIQYPTFEWQRNFFIFVFCSVPNFENRFRLNLESGIMLDSMLQPKKRRKSFKWKWSWTILALISHRQGVIFRWTEFMDNDFDESSRKKFNCCHPPPPHALWLSTLSGHSPKFQSRIIFSIEVRTEQKAIPKTQQRKTSKYYASNDGQFRTKYINE